MKNLLEKIPRKWEVIIGWLCLAVLLVSIYTNEFLKLGYGLVQITLNVQLLIAGVYFIIPQRLDKMNVRGIYLIFVCLFMAYVALSYFSIPR